MRVSEEQAEQLPRTDPMHKRGPRGGWKNFTPPTANGNPETVQTIQPQDKKASK